MYLSGLRNAYHITELCTAAVVSGCGYQGTFNTELVYLHRGRVGDTCFDCWPNGSSGMGVYSAIYFHVSRS